MTAPHYTPSGDPVFNSSGASNLIRDEYIAIEAALDKFAPFTANGVVQINSAGTAQEANVQLTLAADLDFSNANPEIRGGDTNGEMFFSPGATNILGGVVRLYGDTHASKPSYIEFYEDATRVGGFNATTGNWDFDGISGVTSIIDESDAFFYGGI